MLFQNQRTIDAKQYSLRSHGRGYRLGPHFVLSEMASKDGADTVYVHPLLTALLEVIRAYFHKPLVINSGYRTTAHNRAEGGAPNSFHTYGLAADIWLPEIDPADVANYADHELHVGGVGRYDGRTHLEIAGIGKRWTG